jgi:hypothetical protein
MLRINQFTHVLRSGTVDLHKERNLRFVQLCYIFQNFYNIQRVFIIVLHLVLGKHGKNRESTVHLIF